MRASSQGDGSAREESERARHGGKEDARVRFIKQSLPPLSFSVPPPRRKENILLLLPLVHTLHLSSHLRESVQYIDGNRSIIERPVSQRTAAFRETSPSRGLADWSYYSSNWRISRTVKYSFLWSFFLLHSSWQKHVI